MVILRGRSEKGLLIFAVMVLAGLWAFAGGSDDDS